MIAALGTERNRPRVRNGLIAFASALALLAGALYVVMPTHVALAVTVSVEHRADAPGGIEVLYGYATDVGGKPMQGVRIAADSDARDGGRNRVMLVSGRDGTYRRQVKLAAGTYVLTVDGPGLGHRSGDDTADIRVLIEPGNAYRISVRQLRRGAFSFLPVISY